MLMKYFKAMQDDEESEREWRQSEGGPALRMKLWCDGKLSGHLRREQMELAFGSGSKISFIIAGMERRLDLSIISWKPCRDQRKFAHRDYPLGRRCPTYMGHQVRNRMVNTAILQPWANTLTSYISTRRYISRAPGGK